MDGEPRRTGMDAAALDARKAALRRLARAQRAALATPDAPIRLIENFPAALGALDPIAGYWPLGDEMDPRLLLAALAKAGRRIALPRMLSRAGPAKFLLWRADAPLEADAFGVLAPPLSAQEVTPKLILVPLLAFDRAGARLGQGGGHYDRILATLRPGALAIGLAYAGQEMADLPCGPHDQRLDGVVTDAGAISFLRPVEGLRGRA